MKYDAEGAWAITLSQRRSPPQTTTINRWDGKVTSILHQIIVCFYKHDAGVSATRKSFCKKSEKILASYEKNRLIPRYDVVLCDVAKCDMRSVMCDLWGALWQALTKCVILQTHPLLSAPAKHTSIRGVINHMPALLKVSCFMRDQFAYFYF